VPLIVAHAPWPEADRKRFRPSRDRCRSQWERYSPKGKTSSAGSGICRVVGERVAHPPIM